MTKKSKQEILSSSIEFIKARKRVVFTYRLWLVVYVGLFFVDAIALLWGVTFIALGVEGGVVFSVVGMIVIGFLADRNDKKMKEKIKNLEEEYNKRRKEK